MRARIQVGNPQPGPVSWPRRVLGGWVPGRDSMVPDAPTAAAVGGSSSRSCTDLTDMESLWSLRSEDAKSEDSELGVLHKPCGCSIVRAGSDRLAPPAALLALAAATAVTGPSPSPPMTPRVPAVRRAAAAVTGSVRSSGTCCLTAAVFRGRTPRGGHGRPEYNRRRPEPSTSENTAAAPARRRAAKAVWLMAPLSVQAFRSASRPMPDRWSLIPHRRLS